jgi:putative membrane protein
MIIYNEIIIVVYGELGFLANMNFSFFDFFSGKGIWVWEFDPSILIGIALWTIGYIFLVRYFNRRKESGHIFEPHQQLFFHLGTLVLFIALVSPLDHLADVFLFSAHMVQHLLLLMVAPPLWLMGFPSGVFDEQISGKAIKAILRAVTNPVLAFFLFNIVFLAWHIPRLYDAALSNENIHIIEHLSFIAVASIGWWPLLGFLPETAPRVSIPVQVIYCFLMMLPATILAAIITFAPNPLYPFYLNAPKVIGNTVLPAFANGPRLWGLSVMDDQEISGLIMWVPGNMVFFSAAMLVLRKWYQKEEKGEQKRGSFVMPGEGVDSLEKIIKS